MTEQNLPKDVQQALENLTGTDKEFLKTVVSEKGELNEEALLNVSGGVSLSEAGTKTLNWLKNNYGKVLAGVGAVAGSAGIITGSVIIGKKLWKKKNSSKGSSKTLAIEAPPERLAITYPDYGIPKTSDNDDDYADLNDGSFNLYE